MEEYEILNIELLAENMNIVKNKKYFFLFLLDYQNKEGEPWSA